MQKIQVLSTVLARVPQSQVILELLDCGDNPAQTLLLVQMEKLRSMQAKWLGQGTQRVRGKTGNRREGSPHSIWSSSCYLSLSSLDLLSLRGIGFPGRGLRGGG